MSRQAYGFRDREFYKLEILGDPRGHVRFSRMGHFLARGGSETAISIIDGNDFGHRFKPIGVELGVFTDRSA